MKRLVSLIYMVVLLFSFAQGATITAIASGNWSDPSIWDLGRIPAEGDDVQINNNYVVTVDQSYTYTVLTVNIGWSGSLNIPDGVTLTISDFSSSNGGGTPVQIDGRLNVSNQVSQTGGKVIIGTTGYIYVTGDYSTSGGSNVEMQVDGTLEVDTYTVSSITVTVGPEGKIIVHGDFTNSSGATFTLNGGEFLIEGNYDNQGDATITLNDNALLHIYGDYLNAGGSDIIVNSGTVIIDGNVSNQGGSTFTIADGSYVEVNGDLSNTGGGNITVDGSLYVEGDLTNRGGGTIDGDGSLYVGGDIDDPQDQIEPGLLVPKVMHSIASGSWLDPAIWSTKDDNTPCNCTPPINSDVTISANTQVTINNVVKVNKLVVEENAQLTLDAEANVTVFDDFTLNGTIILQNDLTSSPNFLDQKTITYGANAKVVNNLTVSSKQFHYVGSFIPGVSTSTLSDGNPNVYQYDETQPDNWLDADPDNDYLGWVSPASTMTPGQGFIFYTDAVKTYTFTGTELTTGNVEVNVTNTVHSEFSESSDVDGWNLVANPYPSSINAQTFLNDNSAILDGNIYLWDDDNSSGADYSSSDYIQYNLAGSIVNSGNGTEFDGFIAPNQAFFVKVTASGTINFNNAQRSENNSVMLKSVPVANDLKKIYLSLFNTDTSLYNEILIAFSSVTTDGMDYGYDGLKKKGNSAIAFYSMLDNYELGIQSLSDDFETKIIHLGFMAGNAGKYTINLKNYNTPLNYEILLYDKYTGEQTNLMHESYGFTTDEGTFNDRFVLIVNKKAALSGTAVSGEPAPVIYVAGKKLYVNNDTDRDLYNAVIQITDMTGRVIYRENRNIPEFARNTIDLSTLPVGAYIATLQTTTGLQTVKFVIFN